MMKHLLFVSLLLTMLIFLSACQKSDSSPAGTEASETLSDKEEETSSDPIAEASSTEEKEETSSVTEESSEASESTEEAEESEASSVIEDTEEEVSSEEESEAQPAASLERVPFEEITVADNDECTIKITKCELEDPKMYTLNAYLENKSSEKTLTYRIRNSAVNGVDYFVSFDVTLAPGEKTNQEFYVEYDALGLRNEVDIKPDEFTDIELLFIAFNADDYMEDLIVQEIIHIYPYGEENATKFVRESKPSDHVLIDNDYASVIITDLEPRNSEYEVYLAIVYILNKTDSPIKIQMDNTSLNGNSVEDIWIAPSVLAGNSKFCAMWWYKATFEEYDITDVEELEFKVSACNDFDWSQIYFEETCTVNP